MPDFEIVGYDCNSIQKCTATTISKSQTKYKIFKHGRIFQGLRDKQILLYSAKSISFLTFNNPTEDLMFKKFNDKQTSTF